MKSHAISIVLVSVLTLIACNNQPIPVSEEGTLDPQLFVGKWILDSSSNPNVFRNSMFILENGDVYLFSGTDGGSCRKFNKHHSDTITSEYGEKMFVQLLDSNKFEIRGEYSNWQDFYIRSPFESELSRSLLADSLRTNLIGWWKVKPSAESLDAGMSSPAHSVNFTLNIREDGQVAFYRENNLDSVSTYQYRIFGNRISITEGCVVSSSEIIFDTTGILFLNFGHAPSEVIILERLHEF